MNTHHLPQRPRFLSRCPDVGAVAAAGATNPGFVGGEPDVLLIEFPSDDRLAQDLFINPVTAASLEAGQLTRRVGDD